jgi:hypothetical protein
MYFKVLPPGNGDVELVRRTFSGRMAKLYTGWSDEYDRRFDSHSFSFLLEDGHGPPLATCRLIFKRLSCTTIQTPMESADRPFYLGDQRNVCEGGGVSFVSRQSVVNLMYGVWVWCLANRVEPVYTTYDVGNPLIRRLYTRVLGFRLKEGAIVSYEGFKEKDTGLPVQWQVCVADLTSASTVLAQLRKAGATLELDSMPLEGALPEVLNPVAGH